MTTIVFSTNDVVGATGVSGLEAARMDMVVESGPYPIALRAYTLNW